MPATIAHQHRFEGHPPDSLGIVVGPVSCQGCGKTVWWARSHTRLNGKIISGWLAWRERGGRVHKCSPSA